MEVTVFKLKNVTDEQEQINIAIDMSEFLTEDQIDKFGGTVTKDEATEYLFVFLEEAETEKLARVFENHGILIGQQNITYQVLMGTAHDNKMFAEGFADDSTEKDALNDFLEENLTADIVLDKILDKRELTEIDKKVLNKG